MGDRHLQKDHEVLELGPGRLVLPLRDDMAVALVELIHEAKPFLFGRPDAVEVRTHELGLDIEGGLFDVPELFQPICEW